MPERITHGGEPGVYLTDNEWHRLTEPLNLAGRTLDEVLLVLVGRVEASYDVAAVVRAIIDGGVDGGSSVPPRDLAGAIRRIVEAKNRAEHNARTFAGELADVHDVLQDRFGTVFGTVWDELCTPLVARLTGEESEDASLAIFDAGLHAFRTALRLVTDYDVRDRDTARPVDDGAPRRWQVAVKVTDTATGTTVSGFAPRDEPAASDLWQGRAAVNVWGVPITPAHPAVIYLAEHLGPLKGCDGSLRCKAATVTRALLDAAVQCQGVATGLTGNPNDPWIRRTAEHLADLIEQHATLQQLATLIRDSFDHAQPICLSKPCGICDGRGTTHRLGCPNG